jgi:uncharacterized membrane protein
VRAAGAVLLAVLAATCGGRAEEVTLRGYFDTCALADDVMLANMSVVTIDPRRDGIVGHFRVITVDPEVRQPASAHPRAVHLSLLDPQYRYDERSAILITETVHVRAEVHRGGRVSDEAMTVTLARARTGDTLGRWVVIRLVLGGRTLPEASSVRR